MSPSQRITALQPFNGGDDGEYQPLIIEPSFKEKNGGKATVAPTLVALSIDEYLLRGLSVTEGSVRHGTTNLFPSHPYLPKHLTQNKEI